LLKRAFDDNATGDKTGFWKLAAFRCCDIRLKMTSVRVIPSQVVQKKTWKKFRKIMSEDQRNTNVEIAIRLASRMNCTGRFQPRTWKWGESPWRLCLGGEQTSRRSGKFWLAKIWRWLYSHLPRLIWSLAILSFSENEIASFLKFPEVQ
jgi:hypothetical protein